MHLSKPWTQATLVPTALVAILGFQLSQAMTPCEKIRLGIKIGKHIPLEANVNSKELIAIMEEAVSKNPDLMHNTDQFSARLKEECAKLGDSSFPACGHGQTSIGKGNKVKKFCLKCLSVAINPGNNF
ncbi:hypothetical protein PGT21_015271 [Puccinia graminis f. sp. tritici]|uniref:Secreted protein n=1 Tax=Puccinia graminis f. sp. tritici TaxID=56615 RepID=A0A5B0M2G6_PUCGR|nr:hypothetical protein PGT21_015271 [Puccinia graminis f. sp. tritici]KAA1089872.1 hypothetical protein PGTUg99_025295 [Puccinia graminis f. sp. tritici]